MVYGVFLKRVRNTHTSLQASVFGKHNKLPQMLPIPRTMTIMKGKQARKTLPRSYFSQCVRLRPSMRVRVTEKDTL